MYDKVFAIFNNTTIQQGVDKFVNLAQEQCPTSSKERFLEQAITSLTKLKLITNPQIQQNTLCSCLDLFYKSSLQEKRTRQMMAILGQMMCYWFLREYPAIIKLQDYAKSIEYDMTWWEKNKKDISGLAVVAIGIAAAVATGGNSSTIAGGGVYGKRAGEDMVDDEYAAKAAFDKFKDAVIKINFNVKL